MPMTLYNADLSPFTSRVRMQIRAKGLENEILIVDRPPVEEYRSISPTGKIPCLDTGAGFNLPESETIAEFIEDSFPEPSLRGHTALGKAKVRLFSRLTDLYLMAGFSMLFGQMNPKGRDEARIAEGLAKIDDALRLIEFYLEGPLYATQDRLTLADCALVPGMFFNTTIQPAFGQAPFQGHEKARAYYETITRDDAQAARVIEEMADALKKFMARAAG